ncbi:MAG: hypothetical protein RIS75_126, partial [Actinomycetota bacterium]
MIADETPMTIDVAAAHQKPSMVRESLMLSVTKSIKALMPI